MPSLLGLYGRLGAGCFWLYVGFEVVSALVVCLAIVGLFSLYNGRSTAEFWQIAFAEVCAVAAIATTMVTEATRALLTEGAEGLVPRGDMELEGISGSVSLYALAVPVDERLTRPARPLVTDA